MQTNKLPKAIQVRNLIGKATHTAIREKHGLCHSRYFRADVTATSRLERHIITKRCPKASGKPNPADSCSIVGLPCCDYLGLIWFNSCNVYRVPSLTKQPAGSTLECQLLCVCNSQQQDVTTLKLQATHAFFSSSNATKRSLEDASGS